MEILISENVEIFTLKLKKKICKKYLSWNRSIFFNRSEKVFFSELKKELSDPSKNTNYDQLVKLRKKQHHKLLSWVVSANVNLGALIYCQPKPYYTKRSKVQKYRKRNI